MANGYFLKAREQLAAQLPKTQQEIAEEKRVKAARAAGEDGFSTINMGNIMQRLKCTDEELLALGVPPYERAYFDDPIRNAEQKNMAKIAMLGIYSRASLEIGQPAKLTEEMREEIGLPKFEVPKPAPSPEV